MHDLHSDYPLAIEKIKVTEETLSKCQLQTTQDSNFSLGKNNKLTSNLGNEIKYILHYQNLKLFLTLGLKFKKRKPFLKPYIKCNADFCREAEGSKTK